MQNDVYKNTDNYKITINITVMMQKRQKTNKHDRYRKYCKHAEYWIVKQKQVSKELKSQFLLNKNHWPYFSKGFIILKNVLY